MPPKLNLENVQICYDVQSNDRHYKCGACAAMLIDRRALIFHILAEHKEQPPCGRCGRLMRSNAELKSHLKAHAKTGYWCIIKGCGYFFPQEKSAESHARSHFKGALLGKKLKDYYQRCEPSAHQSIPNRTLNKLTVNHPMKIELPMSQATNYCHSEKHRLLSYRFVPNACMNTVEEMELSISNDAQRPQDMPNGRLSSSSASNGKGPENYSAEQMRNVIKRLWDVENKQENSPNQSEQKRQKVQSSGEVLKQTIQNKKSIDKALTDNDQMEVENSSVSSANAEKPAPLSAFSKGWLSERFCKHTRALFESFTKQPNSQNDSVESTFLEVSLSEDDKNKTIAASDSTCEELTRKVRNKCIQDDEQRERTNQTSEDLKPAIQLLSSEPTVSSNCAEPIQSGDETLEAEIRSIPQFPSTEQSTTVVTSGLTFADNKSDSNISSDDDDQSMMGLQNVPITVASPSDAMDYEEEEKGQENETKSEEKEIEGVLKEETEQHENTKQIEQMENISKQTVKVNNKLQSQKLPVIHIQKRVNLDASSSSSTVSREQQNQPDSHCFECHKKVENLDESRNCSLCALTYHLSCVESGNLFKKKQHAIEQYDALEEKPEGDDHNKLRTPNEVCDECVLKIVGKCFNRSVDGFDRPNVSYPNDVKTTYEYIANRLIYSANKWKKENKHVRKLESTAKLLGDLKEIEKRAVEYSSIDEIVFDVKMIKHNRIISRKSNSISELEVTKFCAQLLDKAIEEVRHIYLCDSCYRMFYSEKSENVPEIIHKGWTTYDTVFGLPCQNPHMVVWVQIDGEWYPGKVFPNYEKCSWEISTDRVQVVTFGPQTNVKVDPSELYDYSIKFPDCGQFLNENQQLAIEEANKYLARLNKHIYDNFIPEHARPHEQGNFYINLMPGQLSMDFVCAVCDRPADTKLDSCINSYCSDTCRNVFLGRSSSKK